ncbi:MAG: hypothetical protein GY748_07855 [Planctomycetaceae bacterium]|nr:hypothetical protein [Planctomycetaceae bacterium]
MENNTTLSQKNKVLAQIANSELCIRTLDTSKINSLNFHDLAVWDIKTALEAAYEAGKQSVCK